MTRLPGWRARLQAYIDASFRTAYRPGTHDCALFAAGAVEAMTGIDPAASYRGRYRTLRAGYALIRAEGFEDHVAMAAAQLAEIPVAVAGVGDLAAFRERGSRQLGVVQGARVHVLHPKGGLGTVPLTDAERAFRV